MPCKVGKHRCREKFHAQELRLWILRVKNIFYQLHNVQPFVATVAQEAVVEVKTVYVGYCSQI